MLDGRDQKLLRWITDSGLACLIADNYADPKGLWLTANDTTIYALANVDLGKSGPVVVEIPPGAIVGMIDDLWQRSIADVGLPGPDGAKGGRSLLLPPGDQAEGQRQVAAALGDPGCSVWI